MTTSIHIHKIAGERSGIRYCNCGMVHDPLGVKWRTKEEYDEQMERRRLRREQLGGSGSTSQLNREGL